ncbi:CsgG/HfaB family protein [Propionivibrio sp.]|uniref:CsgG/HfaB family protein n=1 Tax=Propionivibrio sp. TaxID=2212460 RepID=UPI0039E663B5
MKKTFLCVLIACALGACDKPAPAPEKPPQAPAAAPADKAAPLLDVGGIRQEAVTAKGVGMTPGAAVNEALKNAVMQVNGVSVQAASANLNVVAEAVATVDVQSSQGHDSARAEATLRGQAYADRIVARSQGIVSSFKVLNIQAPTRESAQYVVDIEARIAKFQAPADDGKIRIVVAPLRAKQQTFDVGGRNVPAREVLDGIRRQIVDALTQTGRFTVLDRQFTDEIQGELDMISAGDTANTHIAKLGQALSADLIWIGEINSFAYHRNVRQLQTSDRQLVSYAGGWSLSQRLVNVATRQIQQASTLQGNAEAKGPTTLDRGVDANQTAAAMESDLVRKATEAILLRSFPISIVERTGKQVVLSQGGTVLREKSRYRVYLLGKEIKDPQTGQSLGRMESPCCDLVVDRVTPTLSYATLENVVIALDEVAAGSLQLREPLPAERKAANGAPEKNDAAPGARREKAPRSQGPVSNPKAPSAKSAGQDDW